MLRHSRGPVATSAFRSLTRNALVGYFGEASLCDFPLLFFFLFWTFFYFPRALAGHCFGPRVICQQDLPEIRNTLSRAWLPPGQRVCEGRSVLSLSFSRLHSFWCQRFCPNPHQPMGSESAAHRTYTSFGKRNQKQSGPDFDHVLHGRRGPPGCTCFSLDHPVPRDKR